MTRILRRFVFVSMFFLSVDLAAHVFQDNGDGTVSDNQTGLMWQQGKATSRLWEQAITYCENLSLAGFNSWRLPNIKELRSIGDVSKDDSQMNTPTIDTTFFLGLISSIIGRLQVTRRFRVTPGRCISAEVKSLAAV